MTRIVQIVPVWEFSGLSNCYSQNDDRFLQESKKMSQTPVVCLESSF